MAIVKMIEVWLLRLECAAMFLTITWYIFLSFRQHVCNVIQRRILSNDEKNSVHRKVNPMTIMTSIMFSKRNIKVIRCFTNASGMK